MSYIKSYDGYNIFYNSFNLNSKKQVLFFVHGWLENWTCFKKEINYFKKKGHPIIYMDIRGHGKSDIPNKREGYHLDLIVEDIILILNELSLKRKIVLIGHSMGGMVSLLFASKHQKLLEKLVLLDTSYKGFSKVKVNKYLKLPSVKGEFFSHVVNFIAKHEKKYVHFEKEEDMSKITFKNEYEWLASHVIKSPITSILFFLDEMYDLNLKKNLRKIKTDTLILAGEQDEFFPQKVEKEMNKFLPNSKLIMFVDNHINVVLHADKISKTINKFI